MEPISCEWDAWFLRQLSVGELWPVIALGDEGLTERAGNGGHEIRTWLIGHAAAATPFAWTSYEPVPAWITGMGIGASFDVD